MENDDKKDKPVPGPSGSSKKGKKTRARTAKDHLLASSSEPTREKMAKIWAKDDDDDIFDSGSDANLATTSRHVNIIEENLLSDTNAEELERFRKELELLEPASTQLTQEVGFEPANVVKLISSLRATRLMKSMKFRMNWEEFVRTVKVHEMLKCLEVEHRKLKILKKHTCEVQNSSKNAKIAEAIRSGEILHEDDFSDDEQDGVENNLDEIETENEKRGRSKSRTHLRRTKSRRSISKGSHKSSDDGHIFSNLTIKESELEKLNRRKNISDEEFEQIVALCEDKFEQKALRVAFAEKRSRDKYLHNASEIRRMTYDFINGKFFANFMFIIIILSTFGIFLLTFEVISLRRQYPLIIMDACVMAIFIVEAVLKIYIYKKDYFTRMWNLSDMLIVIVHFVEVFVDLVTNSLALSSDINTHLFFKMLKSMRALRLPRIIKFLPNLQVIVSTIIQSFLSLGSIGVLMCLFIYVFAVMGKGLFSEDNPEKFGSIWASAITLFQLLTLDDWFGLVQKIDKIEKPVQYWLNFFFLFWYIVIEYFVFLNLFVAVLVDNFQLSLAEAEVKKEKESINYGGEEEELRQYFEEQDIISAKSSVTNDSDEEGFDNDSDADSEFELAVEDYYGHEKGSRESAMVGKTLKHMASIDLQRFIWGRRLTVLNGILDRATLTRANTYWKTKKQEEEEAMQDLESSSEEENEHDKEFRELRRNNHVSNISVHKIY